MDLHAGPDADLLEAGDDNVGDRGMDFPNRIAGISGDTVQLERALPVDIDPAWSPDVRLASASLTELGVEHLSIEFPLKEYPGHFDEQGDNAVDVVEVAHAWVRDVEVLDADYGIDVRDSFFVTVADVTLDTTGDRGPLAGHVALRQRWIEQPRPAHRRLRHAVEPPGRCGDGAAARRLRSAHGLRRIPDRREGPDVTVRRVRGLGERRRERCGG
jgi:hypothetical protein